MDVSDSTVKDLAWECMDLLRDCSTVGHSALHVGFQNRFADFRLWCDGVGALARKHAALDWRFREQPDNLTIVKGVLALFRHFLDSYRELAESEQPVDETMRNIDSVLEDLALLAIAIRQTGKRSRLEKADSKYKVGDHLDLWNHLECILLIRRDPAGLAAGCLDRRQQRLLESNLRRRNRFLQAQKQSTYRKKPAERQPPATAGTFQAANKIDDIPTPKAEGASQLATKTTDAAGETPPEETPGEEDPPAPSASGHSASVPEDETKLPPIQARQRSPAMEGPRTVITSITASASYPSVRVPDGQNSFLCPCCCQQLTRDYATSDSLWRKHLAQDLQPYTCIADDCPTPHTYYATEADLVRHLRKDHRQTWQCQLCDESSDVFTTEESIENHLVKEHGNVGSDEVPGLLSAFLQYGLGIEACPICGESDSMDSPELITHALEHMHQFSLLSLPWSKEELDVSLDDMWFNPSHRRLLRIPQATNDIDQRIAFQAANALDRLIQWLDSDAVDTSRDSANSEKSLKDMSREKLAQPPDYFDDTDHVYFADLMTTASIRAGAPWGMSDLGEAAGADNVDPDDLLADLGFSDPRDEVLQMEMALSGHLNDQEQRIMENSDFLRWRNDEQSRLLWIDTGATSTQRKTQLFYHIRNELQQSLVDGLVLFLLCSATENNFTSTTEVMRGLIYLFVKQRPSLHLHVQRERDHSGRAAFRDPGAAAILSRILTAILADPNLPDTYGIIDMLGQPDDDFPGILDLLVHNSTSTRLRWLVSGRRKDNIDYTSNPDGSRIVLRMELGDATEPIPPSLKRPLDLETRKESSIAPPYSVTYRTRSTSTTQSVPAVKSGNLETDRLYDRIKSSCRMSVFHGRRFLPEGCIDVLVTYESIIDELQLDNIDFDPSVIGFILGKAKRLFITAILANFTGSRLARVMSMFREVTFDDSCLPITTSNWSEVPFFGDEKTDPRSPMTRRGAHNFCELQWAVLAPVFRGVGSVMNLRSEHILPFTQGREASRHDHFSVVHQFTIHPDHLVGPIPTTDEQQVRVALKDLEGIIKDDSHWQHEVEIWQNVGRLDHAHIVTHIAAVKHGELRRYLMFQWADGGNLWDYWGENENPDFSANLVKCAVIQLRGLAGALDRMHRFINKYGHINSKSILRFKHPDSSLGTLKLAGMSPATRWLGSSTYQWPESNTRRAEISRLDDVWSLGCVILEFIVWMLFGCRELRSFRDDTSEGGGRARFFDVKDAGGEPVVSLHPAVVACMDGIEAEPERVGSTAIIDLLRFVRTKLLVAGPVPQSDVIVLQPLDPNGDIAKYPNEPHITADDLYRGLSTIIRKGRFSERYWCSSEVRVALRRRPVEAGSSRGFRRPNRDDSAAADLDVPQPDYGRFRLDNNEWEFPVENEFAHRLPQTVFPASDSSSRLCGKCRKLNFWLSSSPISDTLLELESKAGTCDFCQMRLEAAQNLVHNKSEIFRFYREGSIIHMDSRYHPVFSICRNPELPTMPITIQIGLPRLPPVRSKPYFEILRQWIRHCDEHHPECGPPDLESSLPTRLIDVGHPDSSFIRLFETSSREKGKYVALSHPWGNEPYFYTTRSNINHLKYRMSVSDLPETFQDAVHVTRELGLRYIWIDAICIIHGPDGDFIEEAKRMEGIFSLAYCVLAASRAQSQVDGFLKPRPSRDYVTFEHEGQPQLFVCDFIDDFRQDVLESRLNSRGWVLQERALARRTIYFADRQTYWECGDGVRCETLTKTTNEAASFLADPEFPQKMISTSRGGRILACQDLYRRYSRMAFTHPEDRPIAIAGLERRLIHGLGIQGGFGVLDDGGSLFRRTLLWRRGDEVPTLSRIVFPVERSMTVPSWSWMAYAGGIDYLHIPFSQTDWTGEIRIDQAADQYLTAVARKLRPPTLLAFPHGIVYDNPERILGRSLQCIVIGRGIPGGTDQPRSIRDVYYVLVVAPTGSTAAGLVERVGVASIPIHFIDLGEPATPVRVC